MHSSIWVEHDGSWTWSIEEGKAFEDGHRVLARDDGFASRGDAKDAMQRAWSQLLAAGEKPGRPGRSAGSAPAPPLAAPEWAVIVRDGDAERMVALLADEAAARAYAQTQCHGDWRIERVRVAVITR